MREMVLEKYLCSYSIDIRIVRSEGFACIYLTKSPPVILVITIYAYVHALFIGRSSAIQQHPFN